MQPANGDGQSILAEPLCLRSQASPETAEERGIEDIDRGRKGETVGIGFCWTYIANLQLISYPPACLMFCSLLTWFLKHLETFRLKMSAATCPSGKAM